MQAIGRARAVTAVSAVMLVMTADARAQENLDRDKSGPKLFAASCVQCHKSARGLAKGRMSFTLSYYLRQHYTASCAVGVGPHRLSAVGRHAARQGEERRREEGAGEQGGDGQGAAQEHDEERGDETADRHDQRRSAREAAGEDTGAEGVICAT